MGSCSRRKSTDLAKASGRALSLKRSLWPVRERAGCWVTRWGLVGLARGPRLRERSDAEAAGALHGFLKGAGCSRALTGRLWGGGGPAGEGSAPLQAGLPRLPAACPEESTADLGLSAPSRAAHPAPGEHREGPSGQSGCCPAADSPGTPSEGPLGLASLSLRELGAASWLSAALVLPDKPPALWSCGAHLPPPQLWLPPHALLGLPVPQAVLRRAHLPLEAERGQAGLRGLVAGLPSTTVRPQSALFPARVWTIRTARVPDLCLLCPQLSEACASPAGSEVMGCRAAGHKGSQPGPQASALSLAVSTSGPAS